MTTEEKSTTEPTEARSEPPAEVRGLVKTVVRHAVTDALFSSMDQAIAKAVDELPFGEGIALARAYRSFRETAHQSFLESFIPGGSSGETAPGIYPSGPSRGGCRGFVHGPDPAHCASSRPFAGDPSSSSSSAPSAD